MDANRRGKHRGTGWANGFCMPRPDGKRPAPRGVQLAFTLMELLIVVSILSLLAAAAYPSYQAQIVKMRRSDAKRSLAWVAQEMERCYSSHRRYDHADCPQIADGPTISATSDEGYYQISSISPDGAQSLTAESFSLYATPQGKQAGDSRCAVFQFSSTSARAAFDASTPRNNTTAECW